MEENPYAPSRADLTAEAPPAHGWELRGGALWVQSGAVLPMVDLYSGETAETMTLMRVAVRMRSRWPLYLVIVGMVTLAISGGAVEISQVFFLLGLTGLVARSLVTAFSPAAYIQIFLVKETPRRQQSYRLRALAVAGMAFVFAVLTGSIDVIPRGRHWVDAICAAVFSIMFVGAMVMWMRREKLFYGARSSHAFEVRGVHQEALRALAAIAERPFSG